MLVPAVCYIPEHSFAPLSFICGYAYLIIKKNLNQVLFWICQFFYGLLAVTYELFPSITYQSLQDFFSFRSESRYLLLLTENYGALSILQQQIIAKQNEIRPVTIFGSSFPSDQEYTQVSKN